MWDETDLQRGVNRVFSTQIWETLTYASTLKWNFQWNEWEKSHLVMSTKTRYLFSGHCPPLHPNQEKLFKISCSLAAHISLVPSEPPLWTHQSCGQKVPPPSSPRRLPNPTYPSSSYRFRNFLGTPFPHILFSTCPSLSKADKGCWKSSHSNSGLHRLSTVGQ